MANNLRYLREQQGWTQSQAAAALGTTRSQYVKLESGARRLSDVWIDRSAVAYGVDAAEIVRDRPGSVPVLGFVGARGDVTFSDEPMRFVAYGGKAGTSSAIEIRDGALGSAFDGWCALLTSGSGSDVSEQNRLCIVELPDGRVLLRSVIRLEIDAILVDFHGGVEICGSHTCVAQITALIYPSDIETYCKRQC